MKLCGLDKHICPQLHNLNCYSLHQLLQTDFYTIFENKKLFKPLAGYLRLTQDQSYKFPVALSHCKHKEKDYTDAIDRLDCSELLKVMEKVTGDTQAYLCAQRIHNISIAVGINQKELDWVWYRLYEVSHNPRHKYEAS